MSNLIYNELDEIAAKETEKYQSIWNKIMSFDQLASAQLSEGIAKLKMLPQEKQQEVLDFIEFLQAKVNQSDVSRKNWQPGISALEAAGDLVGCVEGPEDLSTNPEYMRGFGE